MESRKPVIVRAWRPCMQTIEVANLNDPDLKENKNFTIGHISFETDGNYWSLWSIEFMPKYAYRHFKEGYNEEAYRKHFENLLAQYGEAPLFSYNRYDYKKQSTHSILQYETELEKREPDLLLSFYHTPFGLKQKIEGFAQRVNIFLGSCRNGAPGNLSMKGWLSFGNGLLINRELGGQGCYSVAMDILARDENLLGKKDVIELPYGLHDHATFDDFLKMLMKYKRDELKTHPELKEDKFIYPNETPLVAEPKRSCVML